MARVNDGVIQFLHATHTFIHKWNEPNLPSLTSALGLPQFGRYLFAIPPKVDAHRSKFKVIRVKQNSTIAGMADRG